MHSTIGAMAEQIDAPIGWVPVIFLRSRQDPDKIKSVAKKR